MGKWQVRNVRTIRVESLAAVLLLRAGRCCVSLCCDLVIDHEKEDAFSFIPCRVGDVDRVGYGPGSPDGEFVLVLRNWWCRSVLVWLHQSYACPIGSGGQLGNRECLLIRSACRH